TPTLSPPAASSTTEQSPSSSESPSSSPSDTVTPTEGDPPPQKIFKLADHPILQDPDAGLANRACHLPGWRSTPEGAEAFFTAARECLDAAWEPFLRAYNLPFTPPRLHFPASASFQTQCGTINVGIATAAYYCEGDLYLPFDGLQTEQYGNAPGVYLALFAHEYGHHVQELAGIMDAAWERIYAEGQDSPAGQEMSRRSASQACASAPPSTRAVRSHARCTTRRGTTRRPGGTTRPAPGTTAVTPTTPSGGARARTTTGSSTATRSQPPPQRCPERPS